MNLATPFKDLFFPSLCLNCDDIISSKTLVQNICSNCLAECIALKDDFPQTHILNKIPQNILDDIYIAFEFNSVIRAMLYGIKYQKMPNLGISIGTFLQGRLADKINLLQNLIVIPVPLHPVRIKERGYNQSAFLAKGIFKDSPQIIHSDILIRERYTGSQTRLNRVARERNVKDAFTVKYSKKIKGKTIVLVDDVITTGATLNECAFWLKKSGAESVIGIALATPVKEDFSIDDLEKFEDY